MTASNGVANHITGDAGVNLLLDGDGADTLFGRDGDDVIVGGDSSDDMNGGGGQDWFAGQSWGGEATGPAAVCIDLPQELILNDGFGNTDSIRNVKIALSLF